MAKGKEAYEARVAELNLFGKDLARRAKSKCELCERGGETLSIVEVPPAPKDPDFEKCVMLCEGCRKAVEKPKQFARPTELNYLRVVNYGGRKAVYCEYQKKGGGGKTEERELDLTSFPTYICLKRR